MDYKESLLKESKLIIETLTKDVEELCERCDYYEKEIKKIRAALIKTKYDLLPLTQECEEINKTILFINEILKPQEDSIGSITLTLTF